MTHEETESHPMNTEGETPRIWPAVFQYVINTTTALNRLPQFQARPLTEFDVMSRMICDRMARELAELAVYGDSPRLMLEFADTGETMTSEGLLETLVETYAHDLRRLEYHPTPDPRRLRAEQAQRRRELGQPDTPPHVERID